jgi:acyl-CoA thioesterase FadM
VRYTATVEQRAVCVGTVTYVSVKPGTHESTPIPDALRDRLQETQTRS